MVAMVVAGGATFGSWVVSSSAGNGYAKALTASNLTLNDASASTVADLYPGGSGAVKISVTNPNAFAVTIAGVTGAGTITSDKGIRLYQTKGDSNPVADPWIISFDRGMVAHRMVFSVPYAGNALIFARSSLGRLALIAYVCVILLLSALKGIAATAKVKTVQPAGKTDQPVSTT